MTAKILITGATGTIGRQVVEGLQRAGAAFRVATRNPAAFPEADRVSLDWDDPTSLASALEGVERLFLLTPFVEDPTPYVEAALKAGPQLQHVVRLSAIGADPDQPGPGQAHGRAERAVKQSGLSYTILQPTFFADNLATFQRATILDHGAFYGASNGGAVSYISTADIAAVAVAALLEPHKHKGQTYVLTGAEAVTDEALAAIASEALGREVRYVNVPSDAYQASLTDQGAPSWMVEHLGAYEHIKAQGWGAATSDGVQQVLGRPPTSLHEGLARYREALPQP